MGLTIFYRGRFNPEKSLPDLIEEVEEIAGVFNWPCLIDKRQFPEIPFPDQYNHDIFGISVIPPGCEPIAFTFLSNGRLSTRTRLEFRNLSTGTPDELYLYQLTAKIQSEEKEVQQTIINLITYIGKKYLLDFVMEDETDNWESNQEQGLEEIFNHYNALLDTFVNTLKNDPIRPDESIKSYIERIIREVNKRIRKKH